MIYRQLGKSGIKVSTISLGCEGFVDMPQEQALELLDYAISHGINFIDMYTSNPDVRINLGKSIHGRRDKFCIQGHFCTLWEDGQYVRTRDIDKVKAGFEEQLRLLDTSYLDIGMIHYVDSMEDFHKVFDTEIIEYVKEQRSNGRIRTIGMSSHNPHVAMEAVKTGLIDVLLFSINPCYDMQPATDDVEDLWADEHYAHPLENIDPERERLYELCETMGVGIDVMKVYGGGDLLSDSRSPFGRAFTPVQCIEYALTRPGVAAVMTGCRSREEIDAALAWCDATDAERDYAAVMQGMEKFSWRGHCMYCGHCAPCTQSINIAYVNKFYNLTVAEGMIPETVREHYKSLAHHASECIECGACEERCPFGVEIIQGMRKAAERFGY
jgi:predicted aldo/keto reductase-like oxidoreductase